MHLFVEFVARPIGPSSAALRDRGICGGGKRGSRQMIDEVENPALERESVALSDKYPWPRIWNVMSSRVLPSLDVSRRMTARRSSSSPWHGWNHGKN